MSDAGLGCLDWPGCYGNSGCAIQCHSNQWEATLQFPERASPKQTAYG
ncbi:hypothetical protein O9993_06255 [Vibrio lentus]|nr:hypothetical protein [Vibrio lentus]